SPVARKDVKLAEMGPLAIVEFTVPEIHGAPVRQKNYHAYLPHDSIWIDIHLSKSDAKPSDEAAFKKTVKSVNVGERSRRNVGTELALASNLNLQPDYQLSATHYQRVIDSETMAPSLDQNAWRVAVDNLGMCYGLTGKFKQAKSTFEYGIK